MTWALVVLTFAAGQLSVDTSSVVGFYPDRAGCEAAADHFAQYRMPRETYHCLRVAT